MPSLITCIKKAGDLLSKEDRAAIMLAAQEFRQQGMKAGEAETAALSKIADAGAADLAAAEKRLSGGRVEVKKTEAPADQAKAGDGASMAMARVDDVIASRPMLEVAVDAEGNSVTAADFMDKARRDAAEGSADELGGNDTPLVTAAVKCFLETWS